MHESIVLRDDQIESLQLLVQLHQKPGDVASIAREVSAAVDNHIRVNRAKVDAQAKENETRRLAQMDADAVAFDQSLTYSPEALHDNAVAARKRLEGLA
jgi:hypothetical protein